MLYTERLWGEMLCIFKAFYTHQPWILYHIYSTVMVIVLEDDNGVIRRRFLPYFNVVRHWIQTFLNMWVSVIQMCRHLLYKSPSALSEGKHLTFEMPSNNSNNRSTLQILHYLLQIDLFVASNCQLHNLNWLWKMMSLDGPCLFIDSRSICILFVPLELIQNYFIWNAIQFKRAYKLIIRKICHYIMQWHVCQRAGNFLLKMCLQNKTKEFYFPL